MAKDAAKSQANALKSLAWKDLRDFLVADLKGNSKPPSEKALKDLSILLIILKGHVENSRGLFAAYDAAAIKAVEHLRGAALALSTLMIQAEASSNELRRAAERFPQMQPLVLPLIGRKERRLSEMITAINEFLSDPEIILMKEKMPAAGIPLVSKWRECAVPVAHRCAEAMASTNDRAKSFKMSGAGPLARLVAAVIPHITGETPSPGNVSNHLLTVRWLEPVEPQQ